MKGLDKVKETLDGILMPTPSDLLSAGEILTRGTTCESGIGEPMIIDIGGATTDVHSFAEQSSYRGARLFGSKETYSKRTVESDLGVRESSGLMLNEIDLEKLSESCGKDLEWVKDAIAHRVVFNDYIPSTEDEKYLDGVLARIAAKASARRHAGLIEHVHSANCKLLQVGKNIIISIKKWKRRRKYFLAHDLKILSGLAIYSLFHGTTQRNFTRYSPKDFEK